MRDTRQNQPPQCPSDAITRYFGHPVCVYTRAQAIEHGALVDLAAVVSRLGIESPFTCPIAMTAAAYHAVLTPDGEPTGDSLAMRLVGLLTAMIRAAQPGAVRLPLAVAVQSATATTCRLLDLVLGPGDRGEPVMTLLLPRED